MPSRTENTLEWIAKFTIALNKDYPEMDPLMVEVYKNGLKSQIDSLWKELKMEELGEPYQSILNEHLWELYEE